MILVSKRLFFSSFCVGNELKGHSQSFSTVISGLAVTVKFCGGCL